jgi:hypothetical protein
MQLDYYNYTKLLKAEFNRKKISNSLPLSLLQPSPGSVRRECENVCKERYDRKDEPALRAFFGPAESERRWMELIKDFPLDKFKPLANYLKGGTENTDEKNIELLAWLIDFRHRPYGFRKNVVLSEEEELVLDKALPDAEENKTDGPPLDGRLPEENPKEEANLSPSIKQIAGGRVLSPDIVSESRSPHKSRWIRTALIIVMIFLFICTVGFFRMWTNQEGTQPFARMPNDGCMYWADDHYAKMPCNEEKKGMLKLAVDMDKMQNFRRIKDEDTITEKSIGKLYYISINSKYEYYTSGGNHPIYNHRVLRILTKHIYNTHLKNGNSSQSKSP